MGERLVVGIRRNNKPLATVYYHWSAYTLPAMQILDSMYKYVLKDASQMTDEELELALIRFAENTTPFGYVGTEQAREQTEELYQNALKAMPESIVDALGLTITTHGGVSLNDLDYAQKLFPKEQFLVDNLSRNEGLVALSEESMQAHSEWAEAFVMIDLDTNFVCNGALYEYTLFEYKDEIADEEDFIDPDQIEQIPIDLGNFALSDIPLVLELIQIVGSTFLRHKDIIYQMKVG